MAEQGPQAAGAEYYVPAHVQDAVAAAKADEFAAMEQEKLAPARVEEPSLSVFHSSPHSSSTHPSPTSSLQRNASLFSTVSAVGRQLTYQEFQEADFLVSHLEKAGQRIAIQKVNRKDLTATKDDQQIHGDGVRWYHCLVSDPLWNQLTKEQRQQCSMEQQVDKLKAAWVKLCNGQDVDADDLATLGYVHTFTHTRPATRTHPPPRCESPSARVDFVVNF
eukprot:COSAG02_NODE_1653_length_11488_cov_66.480815_10_plen_220_part_00